MLRENLVNIIINFYLVGMWNLRFVESVVMLRQGDMGVESD